MAGCDYVSCLIMLACVDACLSNIVNMISL